MPSYSYNQLNNILFEYFDNGVHQMNAGQDIVGPRGIKAINVMLKEVGLPIIPQTLETDVIGQTFVVANVHPLSLGENILVANNIDMQKRDSSGTTLESRLGIIQRETATPASKIFFDFTRNLDWWRGQYTFRNGSSCWWSNGDGSNRYRDSVSIGTRYGNGFAIRIFYEEGTVPHKFSKSMSEGNYSWYEDAKWADRGRIWCIPVEYGYIVFNWYDREDKMRDQNYASILTTLLKEKVGGDWISTRRELDAVNNMYLNSSACDYVHLKDDNKYIPSEVCLSNLVPSIGSPIRCNGKCRKRFPKSFWSQEYAVRFSPNRLICESCEAELNAEKAAKEIKVEEVKHELRVARNIHVDQIIWGDDMSGQRLCRFTDIMGDANSMIDISGVEVVTTDGKFSPNVYPQNTFCSVNVFNFYFYVERNGDIRRRLARESAFSPQAMSIFLTPTVLSGMKQVYGRWVGRIQKGFTINPGLAVGDVISLRSLVLVRRQMALANALWYNTEWADSL